MDYIQEMLVEIGNEGSLVITRNDQRSLMFRGSIMYSSPSVTVEYLVAQNYHIEQVIDELNDLAGEWLGIVQR